MRWHYKSVLPVIRQDRLTQDSYIYNTPSMAPTTADMIANMPCVIFTANGVCLRDAPGFECPYKHDWLLWTESWEIKKRRTAHVSTTTKSYVAREAKISAGIANPSANFATPVDRSKTSLITPVPPDTEKRISTVAYTTATRFATPLIHPEVAYRAARSSASPLISKDAHVAPTKLQVVKDLTFAQVLCNSAKSSALPITSKAPNIAATSICSVPVKDLTSPQLVSESNGIIQTASKTTFVTPQAKGPRRRAPRLPIQMAAVHVPTEARSQTRKPDQTSRNKASKLHVPLTVGCSCPQIILPDIPLIPNLPALSITLGPTSPDLTSKQADRDCERMDRIDRKKWDFMPCAWEQWGRAQYSAEDYERIIAPYIHQLELDEVPSEFLNQDLGVLEMTSAPGVKSSFTHFGRLPRELRFQIWNYAILDLENSCRVGYRYDLENTGAYHSRIVNNKIVSLSPSPTFFLVSAESRLLANEAKCYKKVFGTNGRPGNCLFNFKKDRLFLHMNNFQEFKHVSKVSWVCDPKMLTTNSR